jgi:hypothetical protein
MAEHPLRLQLTVKDQIKVFGNVRSTDLEQGTILSHLSFNLCKMVSKPKVH